jgi:hypothetical protein
MIGEGKREPVMLIDRWVKFLLFCGADAVLLSFAFAKEWRERSSTVVSFSPSLCSSRRGRRRNYLPITDHFPYVLFCPSWGVCSVISASNRCVIRSYQPQYQPRSFSFSFPLSVLATWCLIPCVVKQQLHRTWHLLESFASSFISVNFIGAIRSACFHL